MNINIYNPYVRDELYHHGILGMSWGKRNGPPYPLGASDHSASEKKAGWRKSLNKSSGDSNNSSQQDHHRKATYGSAKTNEAKALQKRLNQNEDTYIKNQAVYERAGQEGMVAIATGNAESLKNAANKQYLADEAIKKAESDTWKAIGELIDKGYDVNVRPYKALANKGQVIAGRALQAVGAVPIAVGGAASAVTGIPAMAGLGALVGSTPFAAGRAMASKANRKYVSANKYDVSKNPNGGKGSLYMNTPQGREQAYFETIDLKDNKSSSKNESGKSKSSNKQFPTTKTATNKFMNLSYEKRQHAMDNVRRMSNQDFTRARQMLNSGRSYEEIAKRLGVSESTVWAIFSDSGS